tara:strand:- start:74 stop:1144 length:1071 start_codon:yes stop_codon:yes gene_type:complete
MFQLSELINKHYKLSNHIYYPSISEYSDAEKRYWNNISVKDQERFLIECRENGTLNAVRKLFPNYEDIIFEPTRSVGLKFLNIKSSDIGIDYGCMWGNMLIHCAKKSKFMVGINQTIPSLEFLNQRLYEEKLDNVALINENLMNPLHFRKIFDFALINGVLERIPETNQIDLTQHFNTKDNSLIKGKSNPFELQLKFLKQVNLNLKKEGTLYLAIENRWDYQHLLWKRDLHSNLFYTAILPRWITNIISKIVYGRRYVNYIYSMKALERLLSLAGFSITKKYAAFPDYRFPQQIIDIDYKDTSDYYPAYRSLAKPTKNIIKKAFCKCRHFLNTILYKKLKLLTLAPSFIIIAKNNN